MVRNLSITVKILGWRSGSSRRLGSTRLVCLMFDLAFLSGATTRGWRRSRCVFFGCCFAAICEALDHRFAIVLNHISFHLVLERVAQFFNNGLLSGVRG